MSEERPPAIHQRIDFVDGLRAIAVLSVVLLHSTTNAVTFPASLAGIAERHVVVSLTHGVDLFYVISGFCLSFPTLRKLYAAGEARFDVGEFFTRRIVRIFPPYWCAIGVALLFVVWHRHLGEPLTYGLTAPQSAADLLGQVFLIRNNLWLVAVFWTLQIEFLWYLAFPVCLALWLRAPVLFWVAALSPHAIGWAVLRYAPQFAGYLPFWLMLAPFMLGIVAADAFLRRPSWAKQALPAAIAFAAYGVAFDALPKIYGGEGSRGIWTHVQLSWQLASFCFVVAAGSIPSMTRALVSKPMVAIGVASYSIYLVHALIVYLPPFRQHGVLAGLVAATCGVAFGFLFWSLFERPVTQPHLRNRLWDAVGNVVRPALAWWRLPRFTAAPEQ